MAFQALPTLAGQAALAAALNDEGDITIAQVVIGDGNGNPTTPLETQTALVNLRATVPISSAVRDGNIVTFEGVVDENTGGFVIREAGLLDNNGVLLFVASIPATEKLTTAENAYDILTLGLMVVVSETANVSLQPPPGDLVSIADMIRAPFITVDSATTTVPPGVPGDDALFLVPVGATGAWAGNEHKLSQWNGAAWVFKDVPVSHVIGVSDANSYVRRTADGWRSFFADDEETIEGLDEKAPTHPAGVKAAIDAALEGHKAFPEDEAFGVLVNDGAGNLSWRGRPVFFGTTAPGTSTGMIGGMYWNLATGDFYGPRVGEAWGNPLPIGFKIAPLNALASPSQSTLFAGSDAGVMGKLTVAQVAALISASDYAHSEMFFLGDA